MSGLEFGKTSDVMSTELFLRFMRGELGGPANAKVSLFYLKSLIVSKSNFKSSDLWKLHNLT